MKINLQNKIIFGGDVEKLEYLYIAGENFRWLQPPWKTVWQFLRKLESQYDWVVPLLGIYLRELKACSHKNLYIKFLASLLINTPQMEEN